MKVILANAFSINMLEDSNCVCFERVEEAYVSMTLRKYDFVSAIGHASTATMLTQRLGVEVPVNRVSVFLGLPTMMIVAQVNTRLPEGKVLSDEEIRSVSINYWRVTLDGHDDYRG